MKRKKRFGGPLAGAVCGLAGLVTIAKPAAAATYTVSNTNDSGAGSLRQAITSANGNAGADLIVFTASGTISLASALPVITEQVNIDARVNGLPTIELNGGSAGNVHGLELNGNADGSAIRGLVINRFARSGIYLNAANANNKLSSVIIQANYIGTNSNASAASSNGNSGILANNVTGLSITGNVIGGNGFGSPASPGIKFTGENAGLTVAGNFIGLNAVGTAIANSSHGIEFAGTTIAPSSVIGGTTPADANFIAFNGGAGIAVSNSDRLIQILGNSIYSNGQLSIDLSGDGVTNNDNLDTDSGPNDRQNYPVLTSASARANTVIKGTLNSTPNTIFHLEFFSSPSNLPAGLRPAKTLLGTMDVATNGSGNAQFTATVAATPAGSLITATATDPLGNTSEVSAGIAGASNVAPAASNDTYVTGEDTPLTVAAAGVLANDSDADGDALIAQVVNTPAHGTLTLNADGSFTYTPDANYNGPDSFTYRAADGTAFSTNATVSLTVNPVNDAPVATSDNYTTNEDNAKVVAAPGLLANDTDVDGNSLSAVLVNGPTHGTLTLNADGSFTYTPDANYHGADSFTYRASDGTALSAPVTVNLTVASVNDAPTATGDSYTTGEDTPLTVAAAGVLANDSDADGDALIAQVVNTPAHGTLTLNADGSFTYTPNANYYGADSFTYQVSDGTALSAPVTVNLTVNSVNDAPAAANDSYTTDEDIAKIVGAPGLLGNDSDVDGDSLSAVLVNGPAHGTLTLNADGSFTYTPDANYHGSDSFTYRVSDGTTTSSPATVNLTIASVNDAPTATGDSYTTGEDTAAIVAAPGVLGNDSDVDGDSLSVVLGTGPAHGSLTLNADGSFTYTPNANYHGADSFTYQVSDGTALSAPVTVNLTVNSVNDAPAAANDSYTTDEDSPKVVAAPGVLGNDSDVDGDSLSAILVSGPAHGTLTLNADGSFTYTPSANYFGTDSFSYRVTDGTTTSGVAAVNLTVSPVNDAPVAQGGTATVTAGSSKQITLNATDPDGDTLNYVIVSQPANGTLSGTGSQRTYTPNVGFSGTDTFTFQANDGQANSNVATITVTVDGTPVAVADSYSTMRGTPVSVAAPGVLGNDQSINNAPLTAVLVAGPVNGTLTLNANGSFTYRPRVGFSGTDQFTYRAVANGVQSSPVTVSIIVNPAVPVVVPSRVAASGAFQIGRSRFQFGLSASTGKANQINGSFTLRETPGGISLDSTQITSLVLEGNTLRVYGKARVSGAGLQEFVLDVENALSKSVQQARFRLELGNGRIIGPANLASGSIVVRQ